MNDFDWDAHQKKLIAQGAKHKKRPRKGCTLPSDYMTPAQKRKLNGEVNTVALNKPMTWEELKALPDDIQREYLNGLRDKYQATDAWVGSMLGIGEESVRQKRKALGGEWTSIPRKFSREDERARRELWNEFLGNESRAVFVPAEEEEPTEKKPSNIALVEEIDLTLSGATDWKEIADMLNFSYPNLFGATIRIHISKGAMTF